ncbi:radical SAM protein [uncultured Ruminococcus sp.]|uniref:radical SAM protein n=1 Tax=uncultured Ruminococcus sp. TaxID=165186 RepID=UPI0025D946B1|nr:radical SAM protein [uncultured Ruminococcus sp.]
MNSFELESYLAKGTEGLVKDILRATAREPQESAFILRFSADSLKAQRKREKLNRKGHHVPPLLICSLTDECCSGCFAGNRTADGGTQLSANEWLSVFGQAAGCGISFIVLSGGEPLLRRDVIYSAARQEDVLFPVFTKGSILDDEYTELFDKHRNLFPVLSIDNEKVSRESLFEKMAAMQQRGVLFGASVTVTKENTDEVCSSEFVSELRSRGCRAVVYTEYVPADGREDIAPDEISRVQMALRIDELKKTFGNMVFISFPGDERASGDCLGAGRGFFHINAFGGAEPCPFSPYSDCNIRSGSLMDMLDSRLFRELNRQGVLTGWHDGGCVLYERRELVEKILEEQKR